MLLDFPARPTVSPCAALGSGYRAAGRRDCRNGPERTGPARPSRLGPSRPGPSRARARGAEKDQDQAVELPRFRSRNAAKSSERSVDRRFRHRREPHRRQAPAIWILVMFLVKPVYASTILSARRRSRWLAQMPQSRLALPTLARAPLILLYSASGSSFSGHSFS